MKKLSIIIALMLVAFAASAQSGREKGFVFRPEVGIGFYGVNTFENICTINTFEKRTLSNTMNNSDVFLKYDGTNGFAYNLMANVGYNFNPYIFLGGGVGLYGGSGASLALYANPRFYLGDKKTSFFFDLKAGYLLGLSGKSAFDDDSYYLYKGPKYYYWDAEGNLFNNTDDYNKFVTVKDNSLMAKGYFFSIGFGWEVNRSSFGVAFDFFNMNLTTTVEQHYWSFATNGDHSTIDVPEVYHNDVVKYDDANKMGYSVAFKYAYSIF